MRRTQIRIAAFIVALSCCAGVPVRSAEPYTLNAILSLTGSGAFLGGDQAAGFHLAESAVNASGGIAGTTNRARKSQRS